MARPKRRKRTSIINVIEMTPLIDLTFLLLITFMITMPIMDYNVDVSPPEMNAEPIPDQKSIYVSLTKSGIITLKNIPVDKSELTDRLKTVIGNDKTTTIFLRADGRCSYNEVMDVMKEIKAAGVKNISLITQAEST